RRSDNYGVYSLWLTYGLSPQWAKPDEHGLVAIPLAPARTHPGAYGYRWEIDPSPDGRFAGSCRVIRDSGLDLSDEEELRRPELDYPETSESLKEYKDLLRDRKRYPNVYVKLRYDCSEFRGTNGMALPVASKVEVSLSPWGGEKPWRIVTLKA